MRSTFPIRRLSSTFVATLVAGLAVVLVVGPVAADTELGHTGTVGRHSLRDTEARPGVTCRYQTLSEGQLHYEGKLNRLDVRPPKMRSIGTSQRVGWRFIVQRTNLHNPDARWKRTYRSPIQKATAYSNKNASFTPMSVRVNVPADGIDGAKQFAYRVRIKMFWYRPNGTVRGTARHSVDYYRTVIQSTFWGSSGFDEDGLCVGWMAWVT